MAGATRGECLKPLGSCQVEQLAGRMPYASSVSAGEDYEKCIYIRIKIYYICKYICGVIS